MDGGGRFAGSLSKRALSRLRQAGAAAALQRRRGERRGSHGVRMLQSPGRCRRFARSLDRVANRLARLPRHAGLIATILTIAASAGYGAVLSGQADKIVDLFKDVRDTAANAAGFSIAAVAVTGERHLSREEILAAAGVTGRASRLGFDVAGGRALRRYADLPLVVGIGAETRAREFLAMLDRRPELRANVRACVLVAERRWNLRLKNGVDVRLPEFDVEQALDQLAALERDTKLSNRDITAIDLRLADRITVRLSDGALQAREEAAKKKLQKPKGGSA